MWFSGSGEETTLKNILNEICLHSKRGGRIFIGCDSQISRDKCTFSTVICFHGADNQQGGYYFFKREKYERNSFPSMMTRLIKEVELSIQMGDRIMEKLPEADIEIHIDANSKKEESTSRFADMLTGYAKGAGFKCKIKPHAWASNSIADKHSK